MSSLKPLLHKQKLRIDDHHWGDRVAKEWDRSDDDIHLEKVTEMRYANKNINLVIKIPLNSRREVQVIANGKTTEDQIPPTLLKEIRSVLSKGKIRDRFVKDMENVLKKYDSIFPNEKKVIKALESIVQHFGLSWKLERRLIYDNYVLNEIEEVWVDEDQRVYSLRINKDFIEAGELSAMKKHL